MVALTDQAIAKIKDLIMSGEFEADSKLPKEQELAQRGADGNRGPRRAGLGLEREAEVVTGLSLARHVRVGEDEGGSLGLGLVDAFVEAACADVRELGAAEGDVCHLLHRRAVIDAQNDLLH
jgi:DNA-binding transcriptional regulator YhcF (GntR family)